VLDMNWRKQGLINQAARDLRPGAIPTSTTLARFATRCVTCRKTISRGDPISMIRLDGVRHWRHATCALPCGPGTTAEATRR